MLTNPAAPRLSEANAVCHQFQKMRLTAGLTSVQRGGERKPPRASAEGAREECSNSSGVKLLRWKIALTVMMLLFRVARVTLSFTSATPAGSAGLPVSHRATHCPVSEQAFHLSLEKQAPQGAPGVVVLGELGLAGPCAWLPKLLIPFTRVWIGTLRQPVEDKETRHVGQALVGQDLCVVLNMHELL